MRGKPSTTLQQTDKLRITPAHAGKTNNLPILQLILKDHPRACGENLNKNQRKDKI